jgi:hypothetical protein
MLVPRRCSMMLTLRILLIIAPLVGVFSCQTRSRKEQQHENHHVDMELLISKKAKYCELGRVHGEQMKWNIGTCDSLLDSSLWGVACGELPIETFMNDEGQWFRTSTHDCFPGPGVYGGSRTDISKDMFRGLFHYLLHYGKLDLLNKTISYGSSHQWVMGNGESEFEIASRCLFSPEMISQIYDLQEYLEGKEVHPTEEAKLAEPIREGYGAHLQVLNILWRGRLYGALTDGEVEVLKAQAERQPDNALFNFAYHRYNHDHPIENVISVLKNELYFPYNRLPNNRDRCRDYLFAHDKANDWLPCPEQPEDEHPGTDLVFAISVLDGTLDKPVSRATK